MRKIRMAGVAFALSVLVAAPLRAQPMLGVERLSMLWIETLEVGSGLFSFDKIGAGQDPDGSPLKDETGSGADDPLTETGMRVDPDGTSDD